MNDRATELRIGIALLKHHRTDMVKAIIDDIGHSGGTIPNKVNTMIARSLQAGEIIAQRIEAMERSLKEIAG